MDLDRYRQLNFLPLTEQDLPQLHAWMQEPHILDYYHRKPALSWDEICAKYLPRIDPVWPTRCYIVCVERPIGYIQTYRVADYPEYAAAIGESHGISLDLFIGEADLLGRGWGRLILAKFLEEVAFPLFPTQTVCWIHHEPRNHRALRASKAAGFRFVREIVEEGERQELLVFRRGVEAGVS